MKTEAELKKLAEFAAEFLGWELCPQNQWKIPDNIEWLYYVTHKHRDELPRDFFEGHSSAPILAHLAKREMEKRGFRWISSYGYHAHTEDEYFYEFTKWGETEEDEKTGSAFNKENNFIALWSAIEQTGEK